MPHTGKDLGADLYDLEKAAKHDLPTLAGVYQDAVDRCNAAGNGPPDMARVPEQFTNGQHGSVLDAYTALHRAVVGVLQDTRTSLHETGIALGQAAQLYADTDRAAAAEFKRLLHDDGQPKPE